MFQLKRLAVVWLCLIIVLSVVTGCAKKAENTSPDVNVRTNTPAAPGEKAVGGTDKDKASAPAARKGDVWSQMADARGSLSSYTMVMNHEGRAMEQSVKMKNGKPVRVQMNAGEGRWILAQVDKKMQYMYDPQQKVALKTPIGDKEANQDLGIDELKAKNPKIVDADLNGMPCWKVTVEGRTFFVDKKYGLPRQMQSDGKTLKIDYKDINNVPDSKFELPKDVVVKDMADMMKNMPKPPAQGGR